MADIELVIRIPEKTYKHILSMQFYIPGLRSGKSLLEEILKAIRTGIPLQKGHGKLIDADEEIQRFCGKACGCTIEECGYGFYCPLVRRMISAPAIIDADKEQKGERL